MIGKHVVIDTLDNFKAKLSLIPSSAIVLIKDVGQIYAHGTYFGAQKTYSLLTKTADGLAPQGGTSASSLIEDGESEWVLTVTNGENPSWRRLPANAFNSSSYTLSSATTSDLGGIKVGQVYTATFDDLVGQYYKINVDKNGLAYVNVPWTNTVFTASGNGITMKDNVFSLSLNSTSKLDLAIGNKIYAVSLDKNGKLCVSVPWTDTNNIFVGATETKNGSSGMVPASIANQHRYFLRGDGTWVKPNLSDLNDDVVNGKYLPLTGGTISGSLVIQASSPGVTFKKSNALNPFASLGIYSNKLSMYVNSENKYYDILHSDNYSSYALPLSGGTMNGVLNMKNDVNPRILFIPNSGSSTLGAIYLMGGSSTAYSGIKYKFRQWSYTANSLTRLSYYEDYNLPETPAGLTANASYTILTTKNASVSGGGSTWGSSITVKINDTTKTLTIPANPNTWRGITDSYSGTDSTISLSQKGGNALYNALVNGYASSAGNADTVDNLHASDFVRAYGTYGASYSYDSDWGLSIVTFDPVVSGTYPENNPNITILNLGNNYARRKQLACMYNNNNIYYRRRVDSSWSGWVRLAISGESYTKSEADSRFINAAGDTMTGTLYIGDSKHYLQYYTGGKYVELYNVTAATGIGVWDTGEAKVFNSNGLYKIWHEGNDGSGSGLDADLLDGIDSTRFLRQVIVPNNTENDFNTFSNMTLTGRVDPTTGASLKNAPWSGSGPAGGYGTLTYLFNGSGYGTQMAWGYNSNKIYIRNRYWGGSGVGSIWSTTWDAIALTSDIPTVTNYYWANINVSASSNAYTTPQFGKVTIYDGTNAILSLKTTTAGGYAYLAAYNTGGLYGADIVLHSGSAMVLGSGESAASMYDNNVDSLRGSENLYLTADTLVKIFTNCDSIGNRKHAATFTTDGYSFFHSYINIGGHEKNASSPSYVWGSNSTDNYLRSYQTSSLSVSYATSAGNADTVDGQHFSYSNSSNSPTYLWASNSNGTNFLAARGSISVNYANYAGYLPTCYAGGQQTNPQTYFSNGVGVKVAMTGMSSKGTSYWSDTLWVNGYSGGDVPNMCALHFNRDGTPRAFISTQSNQSTSYGTFYEFITGYNIGSQSVNYATSAGNANTVDGYHISVGSSAGTNSSTIYFVT